MSGTKVYVGGLRADISEREVEDQFARFGRLYKVWVARKPPGFAFIDFEDFRDAEDAVRKLDGYNGWRVEISKSRGPGPRGAPPRGRGDMACFVCGEVGHLARDCRNGQGSRGGGGYSPRRRSPSPRRRSPSPRRRSPSPRRRSPSPRRRSPSPRRASPSPRRRSLSPRRASPSPRRISPSPRRRSPSPIVRGRSRSRSPVPIRRSRSRS